MEAADSVLMLLMLLAAELAELAELLLLVRFADATMMGGWAWTASS